MATLSAWKFDQADEASKALELLRGLQSRHLVQLADAAVLTWPREAKGPRVRQAINTTGMGALGGTFWGLLIGLVFMVPLLGAAIGAASGAIGGALTDIGINDDFIAEMRSKITPGTSALLLLASTQAPDKVADEIRHLGPELISTNLSAEQEARLRELFEEPAMVDGPTGVESL